MLKGKKVTTSAVVIIPPEEYWAQIQEIRKIYDKVYERWMPHINILYPFIPRTQFPQAIELIGASINKIKPFKIQFNSFGYFSHSLSYTVYMKPSLHEGDRGAIFKIQSTLLRLFPFCNDLVTMDGYHPHLTLGQFPSESEAKKFIAQLKLTFKPVSFMVSEIYLICRSNQTPFQIDATIKLANPKIDQNISNTMNNQIETNINEIEFPTDNIDVNLPLILEQVEKWLKNPNHANSLPKTLDKLYISIKPFCTIRTIVLPVNWVVKKLEAELFFTIENDLVIPLPKKYIVPKNLIYRNQTHLLQIKTFIRCCLWVSRNKSLPRTLGGLQKSFEQICTTKIEVDPNEVVKQLQSKGTVSFENERIVISI